MDKACSLQTSIHHLPFTIYYSLVDAGLGLERLDGQRLAVHGLVIEPAAFLVPQRVFSQFASSLVKVRAVVRAAAFLARLGGNQRGDRGFIRLSSSRASTRAVLKVLLLSWIGARDAAPSLSFS
jgi:hypothetical protein